MLTALLGSPSLRLRITSWRQEFHNAVRDSYDDPKVTIKCRAAQFSSAEYSVGNGPTENLLSLKFELHIRGAEKFYENYKKEHPDQNDEAWNDVTDYAGFLRYYPPFSDGSAATDRTGLVGGAIIFGNQTIQNFCNELRCLTKTSAHLLVTLNALPEPVPGSFTFAADQYAAKYHWPPDTALKIKEAVLMLPEISLSPDEEP